MATSLTENTRISDVLFFEEGEQFNFVRDQITLANGTAASVIGQILGAKVSATVTSAAKGGGNTGNGTCVPDVTTPALANVVEGVYTLTCTVASANAATFRLTDPRGRILADYSFSGSGQSFTTANQIKVQVTDGGTDFVVGDSFNITVTTITKKYTQVTPAATDGSAVAAGVLLVNFGSSLAADTTTVAVVRGPAIVKLGGLAYTSGMTAGQKANALTQLAALGILTRSDFGV
jgi:hypothetical protein